MKNKSEMFHCENWFFMKKKTCLPGNGKNFDLSWKKKLQFNFNERVSLVRKIHQNISHFLRVIEVENYLLNLSY